MKFLLFLTALSQVSALPAEPSATSISYDTPSPSTVSNPVYRPTPSIDFTYNAITAISIGPNNSEQVNCLTYATLDGRSYYTFKSCAKSALKNPQNQFRIDSEGYIRVNSGTEEVDGYLDVSTDFHQVKVSSYPDEKPVSGIKRFDYQFMFSVKNNITNGYCADANMNMNRLQCLRFNTRYISECLVYTDSEECYNNGSVMRGQ